MAGKEQILIDREVTLDEINDLITHENNSRVLKRLYFVKYRYLEDSVEEAAIKVGVTKKTGYCWQERNIIKNEFLKVENSLSFAKEWIETFNEQIKSVIC